jgi:hypothetical protein
MTPLNFSDMRAALQTISDAVGEGYLVSCSWDGSLMRVTIGRCANTSEWRQPWVMTFDSEDDYSIDPAKLIADLAHGAKAYF